MTLLDAAMVDAAAQLDAVLEQRLDDLALQLIAEGVDPNDGGLDEVLRLQWAVDQQWRGAVLAMLRAAVMADGRLSTSASACYLLPVMPGEWTVKEYAALERVNPRTVHRWISKGAIEARRTPGGAIRIPDPRVADTTAGVPPSRREEP